MTRIFKQLAAAAALAACTSLASAAVIWDQSPLTLGGTISGPYSNVATGQNFSEEVLFPNGATVTSMDIWTIDGLGITAGLSTVRIRVWLSTPDSLGSGIPLYDFSETVSVVDSNNVVTDPGGPTMIRVGATFGTPMILAAGTNYFFSMSGDLIYTDLTLGPSSELGQYFIQNGSSSFPTGLVTLDDDTWTYAGTTFSGLTSVVNPPPPLGDMAFRLHGTLTGAPVPEPISLALLGVGLLGLSLARRRKA